MTWLEVLQTVGASIALGQYLGRIWYTWKHRFGK